MSSAAATEKAIVPAFDFQQVELAIAKDPNLNLSDVLAELATLPPADPKKRPKPSTAVELVTDSLMKALDAIPDVFGKVKPRGRRQLTKGELAQLKAEKVQVDEAIKALDARKKEIHKMVSVHFDVTAEKLKRTDEKTPQNKDGHYLLASPGYPETALVPESEKHFTREKAKDTVSYSFDKLLDLYERKEITRAEFLAFTTQTRVIDDTKIKQALISKGRRQRAQWILDKIAIVKRGNLSIHLR